MEQQVPTFGKSTPRMLAFLFLGVGLIGIGLLFGGSSLGLPTDTVAEFLTLGGFVLGGIFLALIGSAPVPTGVESMSVAGGGDRVEVKMSNELAGEMKAAFQQAIKGMEAENKKVLDEAHQMLAQVTQEINNLKDLEALAKMDIRSMVKNLQDMQGSVDVESLNEAINQIKAGSTTVMNNFDELANISSTQVEKIESKLQELEENISVSNKELKEKFTTADRELAKTISQFEHFNRV